MPNRDFKNRCKLVVAIMPQALSGTTDLTGEIVDTQGYDSCTFGLLTDTIGASSLAAALIVEESDTTSTAAFTAVADADLVGLESETAITHDDDLETRKIGYIGSKRYVRCKLDLSANNGTDVMAAVAILERASQEPVAQS